MAAVWWLGQTCRYQPLSKAAALRKQQTFKLSNNARKSFMVDGGRPLEVLDSILEQYSVVQHGVAIYFGSADKLNLGHIPINPSPSAKNPAPGKAPAIVSAFGNLRRFG